MIKDIKDGLKFIKYTEGCKTMIVISILFFALGFFYLFMGIDELFVSGLQVAIGLNMLRQTSLSSIFYNMIGSSPKRRIYEVYIPNIITIFSAIIAFLFITCGTFVKLCNKSYCINDMTKPYFSFILGVIVALAFMAFMYKHMIVAIIVFIIGNGCSYLESFYKLPIFEVRTQGEMYLKGFAILFITVILFLLCGKLFEKHSYNSLYEKAN